MGRRPNGPNGPLRGSESAKIGDPRSAGRRCASRGSSCAWQCSRGMSDFRRVGAAERAGCLLYTSPSPRD
eukprot:9483210-Alexandrium_andersonii.AAC.1